MRYNLVVGNDIDSSYELIFAVLSIQVLWDVLHSHTPISGVGGYVLMMYWIYLMPLLPNCHNRNIFQAADKYM